MRVLRLLGVAAQAESLRLRRNAGSVARRAAWLAGAALFGVAAVGLAHVAAIAWLEPRYGLAAACGLVALADLALAGGLALFGRTRVDPVAQEALAVRRMMLDAATRNPLSNAASFAMGSAPGPVLGAMAGEAIASWLRRR
ncbi:hypothetical protein [Roseomonas sp. CECT 9278]|uniref:hypothetical protein n=1 Tax=Roseomonas sp. CECT 9278 TaxID=2845823 RepID=UPI001E32DD83|nr:hypothetical protein [Roseomonas sp. CECT 9278]CAH0260905.1 hypothetical protein ROS9278_03396 [Roseomonas sp. CECT 9278]